MFVVFAVDVVAVVVEGKGCFHKNWHHSSQGDYGEGLSMSLSVEMKDYEISTSATKWWTLMEATT